MVLLFFILFFIILLIYQIYPFILNYSFSILEGFTYQPYVQYTNVNDPSSNALTLAQQNANNIQYIYSTIQDLSGNVGNLSTQVNSIVQTQADYSKQMTPSTPPVITGAADYSNSLTSSTADYTKQLPTSTADYTKQLPTSSTDYTSILKG